MIGSTLISEVRRNTQKGKLILSLGIAVIIGTTTAGLFLRDTLSSVERLQSDWLRTVFTRGTPEKHVVFIDISDDCLQTLEREQMISWPWPREMYAAMLEYLSDAGSGIAVFDFLFSQFSASGVADDQRFASAISNYGPVVFSMTFAGSLSDPAELARCRSMQGARDSSQESSMVYAA